MAAHQLGATRMLSTGGAAADSLLQVAVEYSRRAARALTDRPAAARFRFVHAEACLLLTRCRDREIRDDLEFVVEHTSDPQLRRVAQERLAEAGL
jgi:hypothetical protein